MQFARIFQFFIFLCTNSVWFQSKMHDFCHFFCLQLVPAQWNHRISFKQMLKDGGCLIVPLYFPFFLLFSSLQAQARFTESSQKLDLLRYSLEQRLSELPKHHPRSNAIIEELSLLSSPALSPRSSIISTQNQYTTVTKPAALTGNWTWLPQCLFTKKQI